MAHPQGDQVLTQAQIHELWCEAYKQGYTAAIREMQTHLQQMNPLQAVLLIEVMPEAPQVPEDTPLDNLGLGARVYFALKRARFKTLGDIVHETEEELRQTRNIGPVGIAAIKRALRRLGYRLAG